MTGIAHITGGGLVENVEERILPAGCGVDVDFGAINVPTIFEKIQTAGNVSTAEMQRVFNMGVGMVIITPDTLPANTGAIAIGTITNA